MYICTHTVHTVWNMLDHDDKSNNNNNIFKFQYLQYKTIHVQWAIFNVNCNI